MKKENNKKPILKEQEKPLKIHGDMDAVLKASVPKKKEKE